MCWDIFQQTDYFPILVSSSYIKSFTAMPQTIKSLSPEEITNPNTVIEQFFRNYSLPECQAILREILRQAFAGYPNRQSIYPADMLSFWEELEKVTEAIYLLRQEGEK